MSDDRSGHHFRNLSAGLMVDHCCSVFSSPSAPLLLANIYLPLPWYPGESMQLPFVLIAGVWCSVVSALAFTAVYAYRVAEEARLLADALTATELILQREQHLSALDGLAAAAAHELGTPLATIALVAKEMERSLKQDDRFAEDIELLRSQTQRCRENPETSDQPFLDQRRTHVPVEDFLAHRGSHRTKPQLSASTSRSPNCAAKASNRFIRRNPGIIYGLGNLVENAVDFAQAKRSRSVGAGPTRPWRSSSATMARVLLPNILDRIGEPYTTGRDRETNEHGGGLGLGLFIAKTLLERSGATINIPQPQ